MSQFTVCTSWFARPWFHVGPQLTWKSTANAYAIGCFGDIWRRNRCDIALKLPLKVWFYVLLALKWVRRAKAMLTIASPILWSKLDRRHIGPRNPHSTPTKWMIDVARETLGVVRILPFSKVPTLRTPPPPPKKMLPDEEGLLWGWCVVRGPLDTLQSRNQQPTLDLRMAQRKSVCAEGVWSCCIPFCMHEVMCLYH